MKVQLGALSAVVVLFAGCKTPEKPPPPAAPPVIKTFTVSKDRVSQGELVSFAFTTERATSVSLIDQAGNEVATTFDALAGSGSATATPMASSFYVLRADSDSGRDSAFVQVAVDEGLKSVFLVAVPQVVKAGESVDILWSAPGGKNVAVTVGTRQVGMGESGTASETPALTTTYHLTAGKLDGTNLTADATVQVVPVINGFSSAPPVARPGEKITLSWQTAGAESVELAEATFGTLTSTSMAMDVAQGSFEFTVPYYFGDAGVPMADDAGTSDAGVADGGAAVPPVRDGFPLRFTLTARTATPAQSVSRAIDGRVGQGPIIDTFDVPSSATQNKPQTIGWETTNATRIELYADGLLVFAPRAGTAVDGRYTLPSIGADTTFTLVAYDFTGLSVRKSATCKPVRPPQITSFTMPASVSTGSSAAMASWVTRDATKAVIRLKGGPVVFFTDLQNAVNMGSASLYTGMKATFVLEAINAAGDLVTAERTVNVTTPVNVSFAPNPSSGTVPIVASWDVTSLAAIDLPGLANAPPQVTMASTNFIDLDTVPEAKTLTFASRDNGTAAIAPPAGFTFPFVTSMVRTFTASTNGVLVLGSGGAGNTNQDVGASSYTGPALLAPFWDDLDLGADGTVKWFLDGNAFPRKLIVQWTKAQIAGTTGTELTFQVQLFETGKFLYVYKTLTGTNTDGTSATIGAVESTNTFYARVSHNAASAVVAGQETLWFGNDVTRSIGQATLRLSKSTQLGFFAELGTGAFIPVYGSPRIISANSVLVNEVMPVPAMSVAEGKWVELYNPGSETVDLSDLELISASGAMTPHTLPAGTMLDGGAYLVIGDSTDMQNNGGAPVSSAWAMGYSLLDADDLSLRIPGMTPFTVSRLAWTGGPPDGGSNSAPGVSVQGADRAIGVSGSTAVALSCARSKTFGSAMQTGTPGSANESCFEYRLEPIPVAYEDISGSGTLVFPTGSVDTQTQSFDLPAPFTYFGAPQQRISICTNGWIALGTTTSSTGSNRLVPSATTQPVGAIAPLWDDLSSNRTAFPDANVYFGRVGDHTIVQWHHSSYWSPLSDDMNFEVKLFDNGVIEFHYGTMTNNPSGTQRYAEGASATAWIERPTGTPAALPIVRNSTVSSATSFIAPNTAYRFTPN